MGRACFAGVTPRPTPSLEISFRATIVNLHGRVGSLHAASGASQALYRETVVTAISGEQNTIVLVGHSFGIVTISNVTETIKFGVDTRNLPVLTNPQGMTTAIKTTAN